MTDRPMTGLEKIQQWPKEPTPTPHLHALAMRTKAAEMSSNRRGLGPDPQEHPFDRGYVRALKDVHTAILALPLEADHAALLAEAVKLPEIAALIEKSDRIANWQIGGLLADHPENREKYPLLSEAIVNLRSALLALETP